MWILWDRRHKYGLTRGTKVSTLRRTPGSASSSSSFVISIFYDGYLDAACTFKFLKIQKQKEVWCAKRHHQSKNSSLSHRPNMQSWKLATAPLELMIVWGLRSELWTSVGEGEGERERERRRVSSTGRRNWCLQWSSTSRHTISSAAHEKKLCPRTSWSKLLLWTQ
jgi:hypothetical protein